MVVSMSKQRSADDRRGRSRRSVLQAAGAFGVASLTGLAGCSVGAGSVGSTATDGGGSGASDGDRPGVAGETLTLTTTTSTYDTGLLDALHPPFEEMYGVTVDAVAQGTGAAIETARNGDSDVVVVHSRPLEDQFVKEGYGINRRDLMFNDFVIVGPGDDPAGSSGTGSATDAFAAVADSGATFLSRGDNSGTHNKELAIWQAAGVDPGGDWYQETGSGMGEALNQASQQGAYTLSDRGTFLSQESEVDLAIHVQGPVRGGPEILINPYGVVAVNPAVHANVNYDLAIAYIGFVTSPRAQEIIGNYTANGQQLFFPEALSEHPNFQQYVPEGWSGSSRDE
jgi:tungstate transport system substrate-binding protein